MDNDGITDAEKLEYKEIQHLRELWTNGMLTWNQIFIPFGSGILLFILTQFVNSDNRCVQDTFLLLLGGWIIFTGSMIIWRTMNHLTDRKIVDLYPRMLQIEKKHGLEMQTSYYYGVLSKKAKKTLTEKLVEIKVEKDEDIEKMSYEDFKKKASKKGSADKNQEVAYHTYLIEIWDEFGRESVTSRGHRFLDYIVLITSIAYLSLFIAYNYHQPIYGIGCFIVIIILVYILEHSGKFTWLMDKIENF